MKVAASDGSDDVGQQVELMLVHHVIDEVAGGDGQGEAADAVDDHQQKAAGEEPAARFDELPDLGQYLLQLRLGTRGGEVGGGCLAGAARGSIGGLHTAAEAGVTKRGHISGGVSLRAFWSAGS